MGIVTGIVVFVIIWWLVFFMVLPYGVRPPDSVKEGQDPGAPERPQLWRKAAVTTGIAVVLFGIFWLVQDQGWVSLRLKPE